MQNIEGQSRLPLVSVCVAAYNTGQFLEETIASVFRQGVDDIEVIIVNDGSTDNTLEVARQLAAADWRIIVIDQVNSGSCVARNAAFERARGRYICTLDSDDLWTECKLKDQLAILEDNPDSIVIGGVHRFIEKDGDRVWGKETKPFTAPDRRAYLKHLLAMPDVEKVLLNTLCAPASFIKADNWNPVYRTGHDWEVWIRLAKKHPFIHVPTIYQLYRKHPVSTTKRNNLRMVGDCQLMVIENHGPSISDSKNETNRVLMECAMKFVDDALYCGQRSDAIYFLGKAFRAGAALASRRFYRLVWKTIVLKGQGNSISTRAPKAQ